MKIGKMALKAGCIALQCSL